MKSNPNTNRWLNTWAYRKSKAAVSAVLQSPKKLLELLERAAKKSETQANGPVNGPIGKSIDSLKVMIRLVTAYAKGDYRNVALDKLALIVAALIYFVMPLDALPDFIALLGLVDDAALLAWTFGAVKEEVERFLLWELQQETLDVTTKAPSMIDEPNKALEKSSKG